jgi:hypothetical protein
MFTSSDTAYLALKTKNVMISRSTTVFDGEEHSGVYVLEKYGDVFVALKV